MSSARPMDHSCNNQAGMPLILCHGLYCHLTLSLGHGKIPFDDVILNLCGLVLNLYSYE